MGKITLYGLDKVKEGVTDKDGNPSGMFEVLEGTSSAYPVLFLSDVLATFYLWPMATSGQLRYGTSIPEVRISDGDPISA
jgi:hypothetical protein